MSWTTPIESKITFQFQTRLHADKVIPKASLSCLPSRIFLTTFSIRVTIPVSSEKVGGLAEELEAAYSLLSMSWKMSCLENMP